MRGTNALKRRKTEVLLAVVAVALVATGVAFVGVLGPSGGDGGGGDFPTASAPESGGDSSTTAGGGSGSGDSGGGTTEAAQRPFALDIESVEECGQTCRDVTATVENQQDSQATGVTVYTRIHVGRGTDGDVIWEGTNQVGTLAAGSSETDTQRIELGYFDAIAVERADGWITIVLSIDTDRQTVTFQERRDVA